MGGDRLIDIVSNKKIGLFTTNQYKTTVWNKLSAQIEMPVYSEDAEERVMRKTSPFGAGQISQHHCQVKCQKGHL